jgi:hypothetical protein
VFVSTLMNNTMLLDPINAKSVSAMIFNLISVVFLVTRNSKSMKLYMRQGKSENNLANSLTKITCLCMITHNYNRQSCRR